MNILERAKIAVDAFEQKDATAAHNMLVWIEQFGSDEGQVIEADTAKYGPQLAAGTITMAQAFDAAAKDVAAKGITDLAQFGDIIWNALRVHFNAALASYKAGTVEPLDNSTAS